MMVLASKLRWLVVIPVALELVRAVPGFAAGAAETRAFDAAARSFNDGFYERAEREWGDFVKQFPNSDRVPQTLLYQAQSRFRLGRYDAAVELLNANLGKAGKLADQYWYWMAEAQFQRGNNGASAEAYARLAQDFPRSPLRLKAAYGEAIAWFNAGDPAKAIERLRRPDGAFQQAAQAQPQDEFTARGYLLIAEALRQQQDYPAAQEALHRLDDLKLSSDLRWKKQFLTIQLQLAGRQLDAAFQNATNLMTWAVSAGLHSLQAETVALQGEILQKLGQPEAAIQVYTNNLAADVPPERRRQALMKIIELSLAQEKTSQALDWLETFLRAHPQDPNLDLIRLTLGELEFKAYRRSSGTNAPGPLVSPLGPAGEPLAQARAQFDEVVTNFPQSPLVGKAYLDRGWCLWEAAKFAESGAAFKEAVARLPLSEDQAVARFKWADTEFQSGNFGGAISNYQQVLDSAAGVPGLPATLFEQALYQLVRAGLRSDNPAAATNALARILAQYPNSFFCDESLLLVGQDLNRQGKPAEAREVFADFLRRYPQSELASQVQLAIARTCVREGDLGGAIRQYDEWVTRFTNDPAQSQAEFDRAWLNYQASRQSNAINLFTNYVARFPNSTNAPLAQYLVGGYFFDQGDFANAELNYRILTQNTNWPSSDVKHQAFMMAGRAAFARGGFNDAKSYFIPVINSASPELAAEAYFYLGDTVMEAPAKDPTNRVEKYNEAIRSFSKIPPTNHLAPRALGRKADCYLQLAAEDAANYEKAIEYYKEAMTSPLADASTRSQAEVGIGIVFERQAELRPVAEQAGLLEQALNHYMNVLYGSNLKDDETADPYWFGRAGLAAGRLLEKQQKWELAVKVYERLMQVPPLRAAVESKLAAVRARLSPAKN